MVGSSKILTVSYGTFSCTLEGFDDPFSTMRSIAEYFRDLAADDRYFGAEPPTPDAEMLHRIAEREIQRRVETRVDGSDVVLRQIDSGLSEDESDIPASETLADAAIADMADAHDAEFEASEFEDDFEDDASADETPVVETVAETEAASELEVETQDYEVEADEHEEAPVSDDVPAAGSIEEKLNRIRAVVERTRSRDLGAAAVASAEAIEQADADDEADAADLAPGFDGDIDPSLISQVLADQDDSAAAAAAQFTDEDEDAEEPAAYTTTEDQSDAFFGSGAMIAAAIEDTVGVPVSRVESHEDAEELDAEPEATDDDALEETLGELGDRELAEIEEDETVEDVTGEDVADEDVSADFSFDAEDDDDFEEEAAVEGEIENDTTEDAAEAVGAEASDEEDEATLMAEFTEAVEQSGAEDAVARMMAMTASDEADALPSDEHAELEASQPEVLFETDDHAEAETAEEPVSETSESDDDDLWDRDFDAEASADQQADETVGADDAEQEVEPDLNATADEGVVDAAREERVTSKSIHLKAPDEESDRLETETETAFKEGGSKRRRSAIAHLKAAVAATRADRILSRVVGRDLAGDPEEQKDYREDLSKVVKPTSTPIELEASAEPEEEPTDAHSEPEDDRPSPLMLVSELRVEGEEDMDAAKPRRVSRELTAEEVAASDDDGADFADFAKRVGASDLTDLLEAAAAYTAYVEQQPHFSRPQIMRRVAKVDPTIEESREAGLRSFGQLLRQGRIQKLQRGQFTVSESTRFKPEQRIAGE